MQSDWNTDLYITEQRIKKKVSTKALSAERTDNNSLSIMFRDVIYNLHEKSINRNNL